MAMTEAQLITEAVVIPLAFLILILMIIGFFVLRHRWNKQGDEDEEMKDYQIPPPYEQFHIPSNIQSGSQSGPSSTLHMQQPAPVVYPAPQHQQQQHQSHYPVQYPVKPRYPTDRFI